MKKLFDLRFVIGLFFFVVGILLFGYAMFSSAGEAIDINKWCGIVFIIFGAVMLLLAWKKPVE